MAGKEIRTEITNLLAKFEEKELSIIRDFLKEFKDDSNGKMETVQNLGAIFQEDKNLLHKLAR